MKKQIYFTILVIPFLLGLNSAKAQPTTVNVQISPPADTAGACRENLFMANFIAGGTHVIQIHSFVGNVSNSGNGTCGSAPIAPHVFIKLNTDSTTTAVTNIVVDTSNGTWTGTLNTTGAVRIAYNIYIDCSVIPSPGSSQSLNLKQTWSDPSNTYNYILNNGNDSLETTPVIFPFIADISPDFYYASYLKIINEKFMYKNTGNASVNMKFRFYPDSTQYCNQVEHLGINYSVGINGVSTVLIPGDTFPAFLLPSDTLIITQQAKDTSCIDSTCNAVAQFYWQCGYGLNAANVLCSHCQDNTPTDIQIRNTFNDTIKVERLLPLDARYDLSCFNDTSNMMQWEYRITNSSLGALDSVFISLNGSDSALNFLTLIPASSLEFILNCSSCHVDSTIEMRTAALCSSYVSNPLARAIYGIQGFNTTDTVLIRFKTFRCSEENNPVLLNNLKYYNQWTFPVTAKAICGNNALRQGVVSAGALYYGANLGISSHANNSGADIKQDLVFTPTVTDLSVPHGMTFGDSTVMEIELKSLVQSPGFDYQLLGYNGVGGYNAKGYIRATVHCDKGLRLKNPITNARINLLNSTGLYSYLNPVFFHTQVPDDCVAGEYYYYFDLSASQALTYFTQGNFEFMVQACCFPDSGQTPFDVTFHLLANPDSCFTLDISDTTHTVSPICSGTGCAWLPLSSDGGEIAVHCPGCLAPGIIVDHYNMKRTSFGLQDTDNDGRADSSLVAITDTSQWYKDREQALRLRYSSFGDQLTDYMTAHFQAGDPSNGGYSYQQMLNVGVQLPFLQLSRIIPAGLDTMKLKPTAVTLYIDTPVVSQPNCLECESFHVDTLQWRTQRAIHITGSNVFQYLDTLTSGNLLLFTFESRDSLGNLLGNIYDTTFVYFNNSTTPFSGFFEGQGYRLKVEYDVCGNFMPGNNDVYTLGNLSTQSAIQNKMWLSGSAHQTTTYNSIGQMINTVDSLHNAGWTLDTLDTLHTLINDTFASSFLFYCETFGGLHYFFAQDGRNLSTIDTSSGCTKVIDIKAACRTAGFSLTPLINIYPFEYRPAALEAQTYTVTVPSGYHITQSRFRNEFVAMGNNRTTNWRMFNAPQTNGTFILADSLLSAPVCLTQNVAIPVVSGDTSQYIGSHFTTRRIQFFIQPDSCGNNLIYPVDTTMIISFNKEVNNCISSNSCALDSSFSRNMFVGGNAPPLGVIPELNVQVTPDSMVVNTQQVCINVSIQNLDFTDSLGVNSSSAGFVFLALPDSLQVPYLNNWTFITPSDTLFPVGGQIFQLDSSLIVGGAITGQLCAAYVGCQGAAQATINVGWNCDGFPLSPFHPDSVCEAHAYTYAFSDDSVVVSTIDKTHPGTYSLCQPFTVSAPFTSNESGNIYPQGFILDTLPQGLQVVSVVLKNCFSTAIDTLSVDSLNLNYYPISTGNLHSIGISDAALSLGECIRCEVTLMPGCEYAGQEVLPDIILDHISFCGVSDTTIANFVGVVSWDGTSNCTDCFTLSKTAIQDTVYAGDTTAFQILICGNNNASQSVILTEILPSDFTLTSTVPYSVNVPAQGCDTILVNGYFSTPGSCSDSSHINKVQITTAGSTMLADTACMEVLEPCVAFSSFTIPDSAYASSYGNSISNTTFFVSGVFFIDTTFTLTNCTVYTAAGAQIIVLPSDTLILNGTTISGCLYMWQGVTLDTTSGLTLLNSSQLRDADKGVFAGYNSTVDMVGSDILDCVTGIYTPPASGFVNTRVLVSSSRIGLNSSSFKPDYSGQPVHGVLPKAGIEVNNLVMTLGGTGQRNEFFKMNTGIVAHNSNLVVRNTEFRNIGYDTAYHEPYRGTAMVAVVDEGYSGRLTVMPEPTSFYAVHDCHRAIYTDRAVLFANYVHLIDVYSGIYGTNTPNNQTTQVNGCTITTQTYGIFWINNRSAKFMIANNNNITVNAASNSAAKGYSKTAIYMSETMQQTVVFMATGNMITLNNAQNGIYSGNQANAKIKFNTIKMTTSSTGIGINNNNRTSVSCNNISGDYTASGSVPSMGIFTGNSSNRTALYCNTTDSTYRGFYFGGANPNTVMKGNDIKYHFNGLYLNNGGTYIGSQPHHGNRWLGPFNSFGAANLALPSLVLASRFDVDSTLGAVYNPVVNPPTGWFVPDSVGNTFYCDSSTVCELPPPSLSQDEINELIASGTLFSEEYAEETRAIAEEYLYRELMEDSALRYSDSLYIEFMLENQGEPVAYLYDAEEYLRAATAFDSVFTSLLTSANNQIDDINDTLQLIDEGVEFYGSGYDYGELREQLLHTIDFLNQTISNLYSQAEVSMSGSLADAEIRNDLVVPESVPEENSQFLNETEIEFIESAGNPEVIINRYAQLLTIAHQCPYTGGSAVEKARTYIAMINDSMEYFDDDECLQVGIYRSESEINTAASHHSSNNIVIIPNPAGNQFEINLNSNQEGICKVIVRNSKEQLIYSNNFHCNTNSLLVSSDNWAPGVYMISVLIDNSFTEIKKLVIIK